ncbi:MAG: PqqD family protein [Longimicrobiales bacterium]
MSRKLRQGISLDAVVTVVPEQVSCDVHDEVVVLNIRDGVYYGLNPVAARVWLLLQQPRAVVAIRDLLLDEFEVSSEECTSNLLDLLNQLREWELIEARNGAHG